jgi:hypothetical protein
VCYWFALEFFWNQVAILFNSYHLIFKNSIPKFNIITIFVAMKLKVDKIVTFVKIGYFKSFGYAKKIQNYKMKLKLKAGIGSGKCHKNLIKDTALDVANKKAL